MECVRIADAHADQAIADACWWRRSLQSPSSAAADIIGVQSVARRRGVIDDDRFFRVADDDAVLDVHQPRNRAHPRRDLARGRLISF